MQYHALSLARQAGLEVDLVAFAGTEPHVELLQHLHVHLHLMRAPFPQGLPRILYLLLLPLKLVIQFMTLLWVLCVQISAPDFFLVQNPPSIPLLTVVRLACWIRKAAFVIDWHNFGYTILALSLGSSHPLVKIYFWYERGYGKMANGHLCVTKAMQHELAQNWDIRYVPTGKRPWT
jgi:beta-1,4-mannosyltransferase